MDEKTMESLKAASNAADERMRAKGKEPPTARMRQAVSEASDYAYDKTSSAPLEATGALSDFFKSEGRGRSGAADIFVGVHGVAGALESMTLFLVMSERKDEISDYCDEPGRNPIDIMTRDELLIAALVAVANEPLTKEGKAAMADVAVEQAETGQPLSSMKLAAEWFVKIRGYEPPPITPLKAFV